MKKIVIAGGTGNLGVSLTEHLRKQDYDVTVLTRKIPLQQYQGVDYVLWDATTFGDWTKVIDSSDVVINVCGKPVACRYTEKNRKELIRSRTVPTALIGEAIRQSTSPPSLWINASSSAYYGFSEDVMDEDDKAGEDFPAQICVEWEKSFWESQTLDTRKVAWRLGVVLQRNRGLILPFSNLVKSFTGGNLGSGKQFFTWIHEDDFLSAARWTIENPSVEGIYNITSPEPVTNATFMSTLRNAMGSKLSFSLPSWLIFLGGKITGIEPSLVLKGRRIIPTRLLKNGFTFEHGGIEPALKDLFKNSHYGL